MYKLAPFVLAFVSLASAADQQQKVYHVKRIEAPITVDGAVDEVWYQADSVADFFQLQPYYGKPPSERTVARLLSQDDALYCLIVCYDGKGGVQANTGVLDQLSGDIVSVMIDTFNDRQTAYKIDVSASGVRADARMLDDARNSDYSWDGVWLAATQVHDWGFVVEMKIPYKSIKYNKDLPEWGLDFSRWIPSSTEDLYWCTYEQNEGQRISKFGKLVFDDFRPLVTSLNLEVYPVGLLRAEHEGTAKSMVDPEAGLDIFYNPSRVLTFQLTANPDFAQIEADPFQFNISRYETYVSERRPFFTEGSEVFNASGRQQNTGFYRPLELFYSRRIGKVLPEGTLVPFQVGTRAYGRVQDWEYGGFYALTGEKSYVDENEKLTEPAASFFSGRIKKQILDNSSVGILFVGKRTLRATYGVADLDGAFRTSTWQLAYQLAHSIDSAGGDYAASMGFTMFGETWNTLARMRAIGKNFDVSQVGYVPWQGTTELTAVTGPTWYFQTGYIRQILTLAGIYSNYKDRELFVDRSGVLVFNMQLRDNWGYEFDAIFGKSKDAGKIYRSLEIDFSSWYNISPKWNGNLSGGYAKTYNFSRDYEAFYSWWDIRFGWKTSTTLELGTTYDMYLEGNPAGHIEDITYNARPYISLTPVNDLNVRIYIDNVFVRSTNRLEKITVGGLFSYNFLPKSWIYLAFNEVQDRSDQFDPAGNILPHTLHVTDRAGVMKVKYLYYF